MRALFLNNIKVIIMNTSIQTFQFQTSLLRVEPDKDGNPLFCAKDVCLVLGYSNDRDAVARHCKTKGVVKRDTLTDGGQQSLTFIDEGNLYRLIIKSNKPEAEPFESWVCDEVLPSIRKTGSYGNATIPAILTPKEYHEIEAQLRNANVVLTSKQYAHLVSGKAPKIKTEYDTARNMVVTDSVLNAIRNKGKFGIQPGQIYKYSRSFKYLSKTERETVLDALQRTGEIKLIGVKTQSGQTRLRFIHADYFK